MKRHPRRLASLGLALVVWAQAGGVVAQPGPPSFVAPPGSARAVPERGAAVTELDELAARRLGEEALAIYRRVCVETPPHARETLVDRALSAGLEPYREESGGSAQVLLGGQGGEVFVPPGRGSLLQLALDSAGRCTVWVQQADGPRLRAGFMALVESLRSLPGAQLQTNEERVIERGGAWRQQLGVSWRDAEGLRQLDAVTLLSDRPGLQLLRSALQAETVSPR